MRNAFGILVKSTSALQHLMQHLRTPKGTETSFLKSVSPARFLSVIKPFACTSESKSIAVWGNYLSFKLRHCSLIFWWLSFMSHKVPWKVRYEWDHQCSNNIEKTITSLRTFRQTSFWLNKRQYIISAVCQARCVLATAIHYPAKCLTKYLVEVLTFMWVC